MTGKRFLQKFQDYVPSHTFFCTGMKSESFETKLGGAADRHSLWNNIWSRRCSSRKPLGVHNQHQYASSAEDEEWDLPAKDSTDAPERGVPRHHFLFRVT